MPRLSFAERWILTNQYEILEKLDPDSAEFYRQVRDVLGSGYEGEYMWAAQGIKPNGETLDPRVAAEVHNVLEMFSHMKWAYEKFEGDESIDTTLLTFWGFDANNSRDHLNYAQFLKKRGDYPDVEVFNSHSNTIGTYLVMVEAWKALPPDQKGIRMTKEGLQAILDAPRAANMPMPEGGPQA